MRNLFKKGENNTSKDIIKVVRARKFIKGLAAVVAISSILSVGSCSYHALHDKDDNHVDYETDNNLEHDHNHELDQTPDDEMITPTPDEDLETDEKEPIKGEDKKDEQKEDFDKEDPILPIVPPQKPEDQEKKPEHEIHKHSFSKWTSLNDEKEMRTCTCGEQELRNHQYGSWINNGNGKETRTCKTCNHQMTRNIAHTHDFRDWSYLDDNLEQRTCTCGEKETRKHTLSLVETKYVDLDNGTHKTYDTYTCRTCNHEIKKEKIERCQFSSWTYNNETNLEERTCKYCNHIETKEHIHSIAPSDLVYGNPIKNNDGTHTLYAKYTCSICNKQVTLKKVANCEYGAWEYKDIISDQKTCLECGDTITTKHTPNSNGLKIETSNNKDKHNEVYTCANCNHDISKEVGCTSDNKTYYIINGNVVSEYSICTICKDKCNERAHTHSMKYEAINDDQERQYCEHCGIESFGSHNYPTNWSLDASGNFYKTCQTCGHTKTKAHTHSIDNSIQKVGTADCCYKKIQDCSDPECSYHVETEVNAHTEASRTVGVMTQYYCTECGYVIRTEVKTNTLSTRNITPNLYKNAVALVLLDIEKEEEINHENSDIVSLTYKERV